MASDDSPISPGADLDPGSPLDEPTRRQSKRGVCGAQVQHIAVIGAGFVGTNTAFSLLTHGIAGKVTLTDVAEKKLEGEVLDLEDSGGTIEKATAEEAGQADVIVVTAGRGQRDGETRLDLVKGNKAILLSILESMKPIKRSAIMIIVANPCDVLTYWAQEQSGLPRSHVFGSGTVLDTKRLRVAVQNQLGVHHSSITLSVLGEHGDSQFVAASIAQIGGVPLKDYPGIDMVDLQAEGDKSAHKAYDIISRKGYTAYGVAVATTEIVECVLKDLKQVMTVSVRLPQVEACLSLPCVVGANGIEMVLNIIPHLSPEEQGLFNKSVDSMRSMVELSK